MTKVKDKYKWSSDLNNAPLIDHHSKIKHSIIKDYIRSYLKVVANPLCNHVRIAIVDGFCGGGLYKNSDGTAHYGSPIIILDTIKNAVAEIIAERAANNIKRELRVDCKIYFVDKDTSAINSLREISAPHFVIEKGLPLHFFPEFINDEFINVYKNIIKNIDKQKSIFILDPCGYSETPLPVIKEIMHNNGDKREIIWTLMITNMLAFAHNGSKALLNAGYESLLDLFSDDKEAPSDFNVQKEVYNTIKREIGVPFFTPFAIKQRKGWNYWLIHLAWQHRASEVMKEVEHRHADHRVHYGQIGLSLNMMAAEGERQYLFRSDDIARGRIQLFNDIPKLLEEKNLTEGVSFNDFMHMTYNETPLKSDVIKETLANHEGIEIITPNGGSRTSFKRITTSDIIKLRRQTFFDFGKAKTNS